LIDHAGKAIYKGGEIMPLAEFTTRSPEHLRTGYSEAQPGIGESLSYQTWDKGSNGYNDDGPPPAMGEPQRTGQSEKTDPGPEAVIPELDISISDDIDDEAILGRNRRRKRKARTNTR